MFPALLTDKNTLNFFPKNCSKIVCEIFHIFLERCFMLHYFYLFILFRYYACYYYFYYFNYNNS